MGNQLSSQGNEDTFGIATPIQVGAKINGAPENSQHDQKIKGVDSCLKQVKNEKSNKINTIFSYSKNDSGFLKENISSYKGINTDVSSISGNSSFEIESTKDVTATQISVKHGPLDMKDVKVQTIFEWKDAGSNVYLSGSFCNWNQKFLMTQSPPGNKFELFLDLPRGVYQYKFIVDGKWKFSKLHPTTNDGKGNINNIIDTTNYYIPNHDANKKTESIRSYHESDRKVSCVSAPEKNEEIYNCIVPSKKDMHVEATGCPDNFKYHFGFSHSYGSPQKKIGKKHYIKYNDGTYTNENTSLHSIPVPSHVNLNHLTIRKESDPLISGIMVTCCSQRVRNKFLTMIYYKPVN